MIQALLFFSILISPIFAGEQANPVVIEKEELGLKIPRPCQGPPGPPGPPGLSEISHLYTFHDFDTPTQVNGGICVNLEGAIKGAGSTIEKDADDPTLINIYENGNYFVQFVAYVTPGTERIRFLVNGTGTEHPGTPAGSGTSLIVHQEVIFINQQEPNPFPAKLQVEVVDGSLTFLEGASASIAVTQYSSVN